MWKCDPSTSLRDRFSVSSFLFIVKEFNSPSPLVPKSLSPQVFPSFSHMMHHLPWYLK